MAIYPFNTFRCTFDEVLDWWDKAVNSDEFHQLKKRQSKVTYLEAMKKQRSENIFSSLLKWIFDNPDFSKNSQVSSESPIMFMMRLLAYNSKKQEDAEHLHDGCLMHKDLRSNVWKNSAIFDVTDVQTEVTTYNTSENGKIDLVIDCKMTNKKSSGKKSSDKTLTEETKRVRILLENKVDTDEHDDQCLKYYNYFSDTNNPKNDGVDYDVYVFLAIEKPEQLSCAKAPATTSLEKFIKITYQELFDKVLTPILMRNDSYSESSKSKLQDFADTITTLNTNDKRAIATAHDTKKLLCDFYENNKEIINAAVLAGYQSNLAPDVKDLLSDFYKGYKDIVNAAVVAGCNDKQVIRVVKQFQGAKFDITYHGQTTPQAQGVYANKVVYEAISLLKTVNPNTTPADIETALDFAHNKFWYKDVPGQKVPTGYTEPIYFNNVKYLVHTQRYKTSDNTFYNSVEKLEKIGFDIR